MNNETNIKINEAKKIIKCCGFTIFYSSKESAIDILNEVFFENTYQFNISDNDSIIIDAGSNIGISSLFFRRNYSNKIIAFEPDPNAFNLLHITLMLDSHYRHDGRQIKFNQWLFF
tara:strand:- start:3226 stop:3573 length:348 start_codon:yes stop_codon:yes gene_type:complete